MISSREFQIIGNGRELIILLGDGQAIKMGEVWLKEFNYNMQREIIDVTSLNSLGNYREFDVLGPQSSEIIMTLQPVGAIEIVTDFEMFDVKTVEKSTIRELLEAVTNKLKERRGN